MFKKSKRQFRQRTRQDNDSDEEKVKEVEAPAISTSTTDTVRENQSPKIGDVYDHEASQSNDSAKTKETIKSMTAAATKLSFAEDEDEIETFVVKKSVQSRRLERNQKKLLKSALKSSANSKDNSQDKLEVEESSQPSTTIQSQSPSPPKGMFKACKLNFCCVTSSFLLETKTDIEIITFDDDDEPDIKFNINRRRPDAKKQLTSSTTSASTSASAIRSNYGIDNIPDADMIYKFKKQRAQMARLANEEYIPLNETNDDPEDMDNYRSRLVREEEDDQSDDEHGEGGGDLEGTKGRFEFGRIDYKTKDRLKAREIIDLTQEESEMAKTERVRRKVRYESDEDEDKDKNDGANIQRYEDSDDSNDSDDPIERWEEEQIRKAVRLGVGSYAAEVPPQPTKRAETTQRRAEIPQMKDNHEVIEIEVDQPTKSTAIRLPIYIVERQAAKARGDAFNFDTLHQNITELKRELQEEIEDANIQQDRMAMEIKLAAQREVELPAAKKNFAHDVAFYTKFDVYVQSLIGCIDDKATTIELCESEVLETLATKSRRRSEEARKNVQLANALCFQLMIKYREAGSHHMFGHSILDVISSTEDAKRVQKLEQMFRSHFERKKSPELYDEDDDFAETKECQAKLDLVEQQTRAIFHDVESEYVNVADIFRRFDEWRRTRPTAYDDNFGELFLKQLLRYYIRYEMITWNVLEPFYGNNDHETDLVDSFCWLRELIQFTPEDVDATKNLLLETLDEFVLGRLLTLIETKDVYNAFSISQTKNLVKCLTSVLEMFPTLLDTSANLSKLLHAVMEKLEKTIEQDVFIPQIISAELFARRQTPGPMIGNNNTRTRATVIEEFVLGFFSRQFWRTTRLMANVIAWRAVIDDNFLKELAIERLLNRYLLTSILRSSSDAVATIEKVETLAKLLPKAWTSSREQSEEGAKHARIFTRFDEIIEQICQNETYTSEDKAKLCKLKVNKL